MERTVRGPMRGYVLRSFALNCVPGAGRLYPSKSRPQMLVEPLRKVANVPQHSEPTMVPARMNDQFYVRPLADRLRPIPLGLLERDQRVGISMINQRGREIRTNEING